MQKTHTRTSPFCWVRRILLGLLLTTTTTQAAETLRLVAASGYLPNLPFLVRVELRSADGRVHRDLWDGEVTLSSDAPGVTLSTNRLFLRNGMGVALVRLSGTENFNLQASLGGVMASRPVVYLGALAPTTVSGTLGGGSTSWSGVVRVTGDVSVPAGHTLTIQPGTWVLLDGVASGSTGTDLLVSGALESLGTEADPVHITVSDFANQANGWGEIRHDNASPALYQHTLISRGGRSPGVGHTGSGPVIRPLNSQVTLRDCSIAYNAGKVMNASGSSLIFSNSLLARSVMGPEIDGTGLRADDSWFMEMYGPDDNDGIYMHNQGAGQTLELVGCVFADCDDETVDCLNARVLLRDCIMRDAFDKGISQIAGQLDIERCLIANCDIGVSIKGQDGNVTGAVRLNHTTISTVSQGIAVEDKFGIPTVDLEYFVTNCIIQATGSPADSVFTDYDPAAIHIFYSLVREAWTGPGVFDADPAFVDGSSDFHLQPGSPCVNAGDPASPLDPDGTRADIGRFPATVAPTIIAIPWGSTWDYLDDGSDQGTAWRAPGFPAAGWSSGPAQLGYGDGDEATVIEFGPNANNRYVTTYFRRAFTLNHTAGYAGVRLRLVRDDGAVVYLNGQEIFRSNMPEGAISSATFAFTALGPPEESQVIEAQLPSNALVEGDNVVAVELHQATPGSTDLSFDLELTALSALGHPSVTLASPMNGANYAAPASIALAAMASDADGSIDRLEFHANGGLLGEDLAEPYTFQWSGVGAGNYSLSALAVDNEGNTTVSAPISITVTGAGGATTNVLVSAGSVWRYLDDGSDLGAAWREPGFGDSGWASGPAQLGYGDGDEATVIGFGPDEFNKYTTAYFRHSFNVNNAAAISTLLLDVLRDDGIVLYLNNVEIYRDNMPPGPVAFNTFALQAAPAENQFLPASFPASALLEGVNVLAAEIHQNMGTSSDLSFDLQLRGVATGGPVNALPQVSLVQPTSGAVFEPPANIQLAASASDSDGDVMLVEFFANGGLIASDASPPYELNWNGVGQGTYALTAVATDDLGGQGASDTVNIQVGFPDEMTTNTFIALGSVWRYLDDGSDQGTAWQATGFDDSTWSSGQAELGYGDGDEVTVIGFGPNPGDKYPTTYFRQGFLVEDPTLVTALSLRLLRDDGAIVYINGQEAWRLSMPPGPPDYLTYATTASEYAFEGTELSPDFLQPGLNVVAVEVHQGNANSSDLSFDLDLIGVLLAPTNRRPHVTITGPAPDTLFPAPANILLTANATDTDGTVQSVEFYANGVSLGMDASAPYERNWNGVAAGEYFLTAVAIDNVDLARTSSPVRVVVSADVAPPVVTGRSPAPGTVAALTNITVTFSKPVMGVDAADLRVGGLGAASVEGDGAVYTFAFPQPGYGAVQISWAAGHGITDLFTPPHAFDGAAAGWQYTLVDAEPPVVAQAEPIPGSTVAALTSVTITFSEPVTGVQAGDLRVNLQAAQSVSGSGAGPYVFGFAQPPDGLVQISWAVGHGIADVPGNPLAEAVWSYTLDPSATGVVINEIMYHPDSEDVLEEYIELYNTGPAPVNVEGWQFSDGVQFAFPDVDIPANGYLVVAADPVVFASKYPGVQNVVGPWVGQLSNRGEDIDLDDASGARVDSVQYADEGDWATRQRGPSDRGFRGWIWSDEHDGGGGSLEVRNPRLSNNSGQNWAASRSGQGTPGIANSNFTNNVPPLILETVHFPVVPSSSDTVLITARVVDESAGGLGVTLNHRVSVVSPPGFSSLAMTDDGTGGDAVAGDGIYSATLPAQPSGTVVEFYIAASDAQGLARTWPAAARQEDGLFAQTANALYQVDNTVHAGDLPLYKIIMTEAERNELASIPGNSYLNGPNAQMNATFISQDGTGVEMRYLTGVRNRGHGSRTRVPSNYRVNFRSDELWKDREALNLNVVLPHLQHFGSVIARKAGVVGSQTLPVQLRVNNVNPSGGPYAAVQVIDEDWSRLTFPGNDGGNVYRVIRDIAPAGFNYRGEDHTSYTNTWFKTSNASENDWTDLIGMLRVVGLDNLEPFTTESVRQVIDVEQWLRHLAVMNLLGNGETGLNSGYNDDYYMYSGATDPRFVLIYWDLDQILGQGSLAQNSSIFTATATPGGQNNSSGAAMERLMLWPDFEPVYYRILRELLDTVFSQSEFDRLVDQTLTYVTPNTRTALKNWMAGRRASVESQLPAVSAAAPYAEVRGAPRSPTPLTGASLVVGGADVTHYRASIDGGPFGPETAVGVPITLAGLSAGAHSVAVIGRNSEGAWQAEAQATVRAWTVDPNWPGVRINEVLVRNVSAVNHEGTFPDIVELFNEGGAQVNLSGWGITDDPADPDKFLFPPGTTLNPGQFLVLYANDPDGTEGIHLGFALDQTGEGVYLFDQLPAARQVDGIAFGLQLADRSIGRVQGGDWTLTVASPGGANAAQSLAGPEDLRINEWFTLPLSGGGADFVELFNPRSLPVALGGLHLTDQPNGAPRRHLIAPLSFVGAGGFVRFFADGNEQAGAEHLNFRLAGEQGEIALLDAVARVIDCVLYGSQQPGVSEGRCPDGGANLTRLIVPTPAFPNSCPVSPPEPVRFTFIPIDGAWRYDDSGADRGTEWRAPGYEDSAWPVGAAVLGFDGQPVSEPFNTVFQNFLGKTTFYFRSQFEVPAGLGLTSVEISHIIDDGAVFYLNGQEIGRFNMPGGAVNYQTPASGNIGQGAYQSFSIAPGLLQPGPNLLAAELHQSNPNSGDLAFALRLDGLIVTNNPSQAGVLLNEVFANNGTVEELDGSLPDWVEIYNPSGTAVDLADASLTDDLADPRRWVFPIGSVVPAQGFLRVRFDPDQPQAPDNTGFGLAANGGGVYLVDRPAGGGGLLSSIEYGLQPEDWSIGRVPDGSGNWVLTLPTALSANLAASLGNPQTLQINEWMADPASGADWFELYNPNPQPVSLGGLHLSDDLNDRTQHQLPALSFIGTGERPFVLFFADNEAEPGEDHVSFALSASGEAVALSTASGALIQAVSFGPQAEGVSEGRLPDGTAAITRFAQTPTPERSNFLPLGEVVINEVLSHSDPPFEDAIELQNLSGDDVDISGWFLSDSSARLRKYQIPPGTVLAPGTFAVVYEGQFNGDHPGEPFALSSAGGDQVFLSQVINGSLTGYRAFVEFGPAENGVPFGRYPTSAGVDFVALTGRSFGVNNPSSVEQFRQGAGQSNAAPKIGPVVISELMYHPASNNNLLEFIELCALANTSLFDPDHPENTWRVRGAVRFDFPPAVQLAAGECLVLVSFNPATDAASLAAFQTAYGPVARLFGPYTGLLNNAGETVRLLKPDEPETEVGPEFGSVPYVLVDHVQYDDGGLWPASADGNGDSLQRSVLASYGNEPLNWAGAPPTPGTAGGVGSDDTDGDGMLDSWEVLYGLDRFNPNDAHLDLDTDGLTNLEEFLSGTDPTDPDSRLQLEISRLGGGDVELRVPVVAGLTYSILRKDGLHQGQWIKFMDIPAQPTDSVVVVTDGPVQSQRFYLLVTPAQPE